MRIALKNLTPTLSLDLTGAEPWLERIYADFPVPGGQAQAPRLTGRLTLALDEAGTVRVHGKLSYAPEVPCNRCGQPLSMPLAIAVDARFLPAELNPAKDPDRKREHNLSRYELDAYYIEDDSVDLEMLINDAVYEELPTHAAHSEGDGTACGKLAEGEEDVQVYGAPPPPEARSPFARLKDLKLPD